MKDSSNFKRAIFTIASKNYSAMARVMLLSSIKHNPCVDHYYFLVDEDGSGIVCANEGICLVKASEIIKSDFGSMSFYYNVTELNTAIKPFAFKYLLEKGYKDVLYFDPDICIYSTLDVVFDQLRTYTIILTPHITSPIGEEDKCVPHEIVHLRTGTYNLGFIGVSNSEETERFIAWWCEKCRICCFEEVESGLFVDQKWINLVPGLFDGVGILRHRGCNVAYWNLHERFLENHVVNSEYPLIFFHFSGIVFSDLDAISKYQDRYNLSIRLDIKDLYYEYRDRVYSEGYSKFNNCIYSYECYDDGASIGPMARRLYINVMDRFKEPFKTGDGSYKEFLRRRGLLEKNKNGISLAVAAINKKGNGVNAVLRIVMRIIGVDRYVALLKYLRYICVVRRQQFLLDPDMVVFSDRREHLYKNK